MLDLITLGAAKRYADSKADNIVFDEKRTVHVDKDGKAYLPDFSIENLIGSEVQFKNDFLFVKAEPPKLDGRHDFNVSDYIQMAYLPAEFETSKPILGIVANNSSNMDFVCPLFSKFYNDYNVILYSYEDDSSIIGTDIKFSKGWHVINTGTMAQADFDIEKFSIFFTPSFAEQDGFENFRDIFYEKNIIRFNVGKNDILKIGSYIAVLCISAIANVDEAIDFSDDKLVLLQTSLFFVDMDYGENPYIYNALRDIDITYPVIKQLDQKFIPPVDSLTFKSSTEGSTKKLKMTVDDTGKATVTDGADVNVTYGGGTAGAEVFYIDLAGNYPDYTCPVAMADIKAAYEAGKVLECRCMMGDSTATLPLFVPMPDNNMWLFSGAGTFKKLGVKAQTFTVAIGDGIVLADNTRLVDVNGKLPNPYSLTITSGGDRVTYDGHEQVSIDIPFKQEAQGYVTAHNEDTAAHQDIRTALAATKPKACLVILGSSDWDATAKTQVVVVSSVVADEATQMIHPMPKIGQVTDYNDAGIQLVGRGAGNVTFMCDTIPEKDIEVWVVTEDVEDVTPLPYLTFSSPQPFTLRAASGKQWDGTLEYSYDTSTWTTWDGSTSLQPPEGYRLYMRGIGNTKITGSLTSSKWELTGADIACTGNIENLLDYTVVKRGKHPVMAAYCYDGLFYGCSSLTTAPELPATTLADDCYHSMFSNCTSLTTAPSLPATTLARSCYSNMLSNCTSLSTAPELPATTLANDCYNEMFYGCSSLTTAPELPATTLAENCYNYMFYGCTRLTAAPSLPATTLTTKCYNYMFNRCTSLTTAPELPATTLATNCYSSMFSGCTSLTTIPELPATTLAGSCYYGMFKGCTSLTTTPELPATTLYEYCYFNMFYGCTRLTTTPELPATTLARSCYYGMFEGCTRLTTTPELPATTLAETCYTNMFKGCTSLTTAPSLPATTLAGSCYHSMFYGCTRLTTAPELPATSLAWSCYYGMFRGCRSLKLSTTATDSYTIAYRIPSAGEGTSSQDSLVNMFTDTGGTFVGTPEINTTYYLDKTNSIA